MPQDLPFSIINTIFLVREVDDLGQGCPGPRCSTRYHRTTFYVLLLVLLTSVACFMYKLMRSLTLTESLLSELADWRCPRSGPKTLRATAKATATTKATTTAAAQGAAQAPRIFSPLLRLRPLEALERDSARPTPKTVVLGTFETALLPEGGR